MKQIDELLIQEVQVFLDWCKENIDTMKLYARKNRPNTEMILYALAHNAYPTFISYRDEEGNWTGNWEMCPFPETVKANYPEIVYHLVGDLMDALYDHQEIGMQVALKAREKLEELIVPF